jgi:lipid-A-disaccharide synthase
VPVDSPAANTPIARRLRGAGSRVVHLVAPQYWAWGPWRRRKLQAITDLVLCLLPFEEAWFRERGIPAKFVGHPVINRSLDRRDLERRASELPRGRPRVLILPGSRSKEIRSNLGLLMSTFAELQARHRGMSGLVVAASREIAAEIRRRHPSLPTGLHVVNVESKAGGTAVLDAAILWSDVALTVSGTVSLDVARQAKPMVGVYRTGPLGVLVGGLMLTIPDRLLPNILAGERIVPEFVPHCGGHGPLVEAVDGFLKDSRTAAETQATLERVLSTFSGHDFAQESAEAILELLERGGR